MGTLETSDILVTAPEQYDDLAGRMLVSTENDATVIATARHTRRNPTELQLRPHTH